MTQKNAGGLIKYFIKYLSLYYYFTFFLFVLQIYKSNSANRGVANRKHYS